jgi:hypothetical protein
MRRFDLRANVRVLCGAHTVGGRGPAPEARGLGDGCRRALSSRRAAPGEPAGRALSVSAQRRGAASGASNLAARHRAARRRATSRLQVYQALSEGKTPAPTPERRPCQQSGDGWCANKDARANKVATSGVGSDFRKYSHTVHARSACAYLNSKPAQAYIDTDDAVLFPPPPHPTPCSCAHIHACGAG